MVNKKYSRLYTFEFDIHSFVEIIKILVQIEYLFAFRDQSSNHKALVNDEYLHRRFQVPFFFSSTIIHDNLWLLFQQGSFFKEILYVSDKFQK